MDVMQRGRESKSSVEIFAEQPDGFTKKDPAIHTSKKLAEHEHTSTWGDPLLTAEVTQNANLTSRFPLDYPGKVRVSLYFDGSVEIHWSESIHSPKSLPPA